MKKTTKTCKIKGVIIYLLVLQSTMVTPSAGRLKRKLKTGQKDCGQKNWLKDNQQEDQGGAFFSNNGFKSCKKFVHSKKLFLSLFIIFFFDLATTINLVGGLFACLFKVSVIKRQKIDEPVIISSKRGLFFKAKIKIWGAA